jgi:hypothetical protein
MEGGDGWLFVAMGVLAVVMGFRLLSETSHRGTRVVLILCAVAGLALGVSEYANVSQHFSDAHGAFSDSSLFSDTGSGDPLVTEHGIGLYLIFGGAVLSLIAAGELGPTQKITQWPDPANAGHPI